MALGGSRAKDNKSTGLKRRLQRIRLGVENLLQISDVVGEAERKLENLLMKPNQHIAKYLVEFNCLATITGWDNRAL